MDIYAGDLRTAADESSEASKAADSSAAASSTAPARQKSKGKRGGSGPSGAGASGFHVPKRELAICVLFIICGGLVSYRWRVGGHSVPVLDEEPGIAQRPLQLPVQCECLAEVCSSDSDSFVCGACMHAHVHTALRTDACCKSCVACRV
jgi:hypothetical protein